MPDKPGKYLETPFRCRKRIYTHFSGAREVLRPYMHYLAPEMPEKYLYTPWLSVSTWEYVSVGLYYLIIVTEHNPLIWENQRRYINDRMHWCSVFLRSSNKQVPECIAAVKSDIRKKTYVTLAEWPRHPNDGPSSPPTNYLTPIISAQYLSRR